MGIHSAPLSAVSTQGGSRRQVPARLARRHATKPMAGWKDSASHRAGSPAPPPRCGPAAAVVHVESGGNPQAVSPAGAQGLTQLIPATAQRFGVHDPFDPAQSPTARPGICGGCWDSLGATCPRLSRLIMPAKGMSRNTGASPRLPRPRPTSRLSWQPIIHIVNHSQLHLAAPVPPRRSTAPHGRHCCGRVRRRPRLHPLATRLAVLVEAATFRPTRSRLEREA